MAYDNTREQFLEKPLPSSPESERVILGGILLDNTLISQAIEQLTVEDFYSPLHRRVFKAMGTLFERGDRIDPILIGEELKKEGNLEAIGGIATITNLTYGLPHFSNIEHYSKIVKDKAIVRNLIKVCNQITSEALSEEEDAEVVLDHAEQAIFALADAKTRQGFAHIRPIAETVLAKVQEFARRESHALTGLPTGFRDLDAMTSGLQPNDLIIIAARPSMGKCLMGNSLLVLGDGSVKTVEEIYRQKSAKLLTLEADYKFALTEASDFIDDGIKPVFRVTTRLGRQIETTITHPYLTIDGWRKLEELEIGSKIAVPRVLNVFGQDEWRESEVKILGYLLGDGSLVSSCPTFVVGKPALQSDFEDAVKDFGGVETVIDRYAGKTPYLRIRKSVDCRTKTNAVTSWLRQMGLMGCNSHTKFIPKEVFTLKRELIAILLNRLFATDGWASVLASGQVQFGYASVSEKMIRQVQHLLLRFGVIAKLKKRAVKYKDGRNPAWQIDITDALSIKTFISEIGIFGKEAALERALEKLENRNYQTNGDLIPIDIWEKIADSKNTESWASLARRAEIKGCSNIHVGKRAPTRERLGKFAAALNDEYLKKLAESEIYWDEIVSIEYAGNKQVYDLTIPETHNFVANDICVHNTAFVLNVAQNAAVLENAVVAIFSLEMSKEQLVMRMLSSEAQVDAQRFRNGFLTRDEWGRLAEAIGTLSEAKIFIDDTPGVSPLEMRAKVRRLVAEQKKLDLIVVDYMQLMTGSGKRNDNRQQEVSQISRELKALAKELGVPVIALSQLSRAPEARNPPRPMMSDLRESGCLSGETLITMADTGERVAIRDLVGKTGFNVWAMNQNAWNLEKAVVTNSFATGIKPVFKLKTRLGREIRATGNHKFYTLHGWQRLDKLRTDEKISLPREIKNLTAQTMSDAELALLGHLIGDGCTLPRHAIQYTTREIDLAEIVAEKATAFFGETVAPRIKRERNWYQVYLSSTRRHTHGVRSAVSEWLDDLGIWGLLSFEKRVPEKVFTQPTEAVGLFLRHLWATDGCLRAGKGDSAPSVYYASSSRRLASDVQMLLLRLGINAVVRQISQKEKGRNQFHVHITGKPDLEKFVSLVGAVGNYKTQSLGEIEKYIESHQANTNRDVIPNDVWKKYVVPAMQANKMTTRQMFAAISTAYCGTGIYKQNVSRDRAFKIAEAVSSDELLKLSQSDVYWDEIVSIEPDGDEEVYDLTVEKHANFEANGIIVHNSIEQDADVVAFIYREDYYKRGEGEVKEEDQNTAEIIISKQRNGPTGTVKLAFMKEFTKFANSYYT